ncbi:MAG: hypothetical protein AB7O49_08040 [Sphingomonadales bacterium]
MQHFLVWIPRRRTVATTSAPDPETLAERAARPLGYATRQRHMRRLLKPGDRLWFVGSDSDFGLPQPSLDAELIVENVTEDKGTLKARAGPSSRWLAWNDASSLLTGLAFQGPATNLSGERSLGVQLRTNRRLDAASAVLLQCQADILARRPALFISYKWRDASRMVGRLVQAAAAAGFAPWWDRWSAPRRLSRELEPTADGELSAFLRGAIDASRAAIIVATPNYGTGGTAVECESIRERGMPTLTLEFSELESAPRLADRLMDFRRRI